MKLSPYARIFYNEWLLNPENYHYNMLVADQEIQGKLDVERLDIAITRYINEHLIFNSHIEEVGGEPYWRQNNSIIGLDYRENFTSKEDLFDFVKRPFDLFKGPLYRFKLLRLDENIYRFVVVIQHIVVDGVSVGEGVIDQISKYYDSPNYSAKYSIEQQRQMLIDLEKSLSDQILSKEQEYKNFWSQLLQKVENIDLYFLKSDRFSKENQKGFKLPHTVRFEFNEEVKDQISLIKRKYKITPFMLSQSIFALLMNRYSGQTNFCLAYPISIREGYNSIFGAQVNTTFIVYNFDDVNTITDLIEYTKGFYSSLKTNGNKFNHIPLYKILNRKNKDLLKVFFCQSHFRKHLFKFNGIDQVISIEQELLVDNVVPGSIVVESDINDFSKFRIRADSNSFDLNLIDKFADTYKRIFIEVVDDLLLDRNKMISDYSMLSRAEYNYIVHELNRKQEVYNSTQPIHRLFEQQALRTPQNIALIFQEQVLTYSELNKKSNQLANYLKKNYGIKPGDLIALCLENTEWLILSILSVLKIGAAYVPLDNRSPRKRLEFIVEDTKAKLIIGSKVNESKLSNFDKDALILDPNTICINIRDEDTSNLNIEVANDDLAYVIYTSGTTGRPKGVLQQHKNIVRLFLNTESWYKFNSDDVWLKLHSSAFDVSVWEIWGALLYGGRLILVTDDEVREPNTITNLILKHRVTVLNQTPKAFYQLSSLMLEKISKQDISSLKYIIFAGDILNFSKLKAWVSKYGCTKPKLINMYGITETTIHATYKEITVDEILNDVGSNIGKSIPDQKLYVLDKDLKPVPIGVVGELYIGGAGLAKGYLNLPNLTNDRFLENTFLDDDEGIFQEEQRLYKTGDLVRWSPDHTLEYIGRNDTQVKIRGYRVELLEVENILLEHPLVEDVVVIIQNRESLEKIIIAYYVSRKSIEQNEIHQFLSSKLPGYMVPSFFIRLHEIPLTVNGKLDQSKLPKASMNLEHKPKEPRSREEELICSAYSSVLGINSVDIDIDFFSMGGDSLSAIKLTMILQKSFNLRVRDIFEYRTPRNLAKVISGENVRLDSILQNVKDFYENKYYRQVHINSYDLEILDRYVKSYVNNNYKLMVRDVTKVLLTGSTGYLGCNLLNQLIYSTDYEIYLLVRGKSYEHAKERLENKFRFYFGEELSSYLNFRVFMIFGDLEKDNLGLSSNDYYKLARKVDNVIHAAALVKHSGTEAQFISANVTATKNLLEFADHTRLKELHYISTISVLDQYSSVLGKTIYTENDLPDELHKSENIYVRTKLEGEKEVIRYRKLGLNTNIYRVGNLAYMSRNLCLQENIKDNSFYNKIKFFLILGCIPKELESVEVSQADITARAIITLFSKSDLINDIYHIFNPHEIKLPESFSNLKTNQLKIITIFEFINNVERFFSSYNYHELLLKFLFHQGWLDGNYGKSGITILQDKTTKVLDRLGFIWPDSENKQFEKYISSIVSRLKEEEFSE